MLRGLKLKNVGPAATMNFAPIARRFNLLTGDNGLGKSFLLEIAWWALTRTWHETPAVPSKPGAQIDFEFDGDKRPHKGTGKWNKAAQEWKRAAGRPPNPGLVIYARVDGSFSTWDPMRNYRLWQRADGGQTESPPAYRFSSAQVLEGIRRTVTEGGVRREQVLCRGLIDDWTRWQATDARPFKLVKGLLEHLGPDDQPLLPGEPRRPTLDDAREIPTIQMPYGMEIPLTYAPAGVRRITKLAYLLAWTLHEHAVEAKRIGQPHSKQVIVLVDEPETHLHPRWQRTVLPSLHRAITKWNPRHKPEVQFIVATHSPLVLASMESVFDPGKDRLWRLDLQDNDVVLHEEDDYRRGDVNRWLTSDVFGLGAPTSRELQELMAQAIELVQAGSPDKAVARGLDRTLRKALPEFDPFLVRWSYFVEGLVHGAGSK